MALPATTAALLFRASVVEAGGLAVTGGLVDSIKDLVTGTSLTLSGDTKAGYAASGGPNGTPYLDFGLTGFRDYSASLAALQTAVSGASAPFHILSVAYGYGAGDDASVVLVIENPSSGGFSDRATHYFNATGVNVGVTIRGDSANGVQAEGPGFTPETWHMMESTYDGDSITNRVDGGTPAVVNVGDSAMAGVSITRMGARISAGTKARTFRGRFCEVMVFDRVLSTADRGAIIYWLNTTYALGLAGGIAPAVNYSGKVRAFGQGPWGLAGFGTWRGKTVAGRSSAVVTPMGSAGRTRNYGGRSSVVVAPRGNFGRDRVGAGLVAAIVAPRGNAQRARPVQGRVNVQASPMGRLTRTTRPGGRLSARAELLGNVARIARLNGRLTAQATLQGRLREPWDKSDTPLPAGAGWVPHASPTQAWTDIAAPTPASWEPTHG